MYNYKKGRKFVIPWNSSKCNDYNCNSVDFQRKNMHIYVISLHALVLIKAPQTNTGIRNSEPNFCTGNITYSSSHLSGIRNSEPFSFSVEWGQKFWTLFFPCWTGSEVLNPFPSSFNGFRNSEPFSWPVKWDQKFWTLFLPCWMGSEILNHFPSSLKRVKNSDPFSFPAEWDLKFWTLFLLRLIGSEVLNPFPSLLNEVRLMAKE